MTASAATVYERDHRRLHLPSYYHATPPWINTHYIRSRATLSHFSPHFATLLIQTGALSSSLSCSCTVCLRLLIHTHLQRPARMSTVSLCFCEAITEPLNLDVVLARMCWCDLSLNTVWSECTYCLCSPKCLFVIMYNHMCISAHVLYDSLFFLQQEKELFIV